MNDYVFPSNEDPRNHDPLEIVGLDVAKLRCDELSLAKAVELGFTRDTLVNRQIAAAFSRAGEALNDFEVEDLTIRTDPKLTEAGKAAARGKYAAEVIPELIDFLDKVTATTVDLEKEGQGGIVVEVLGKVVGVPVEPNDIAVASEIRSVIRSMPGQARTNAVHAAATAGDLSVLGAVLNAPAMLTGVDKTLLEGLKVDLARQQAPEKFRKYDATIEASLRRALDGAIRAIAGDRATLETFRAKPSMEETLSPEERQELAGQRSRENAPALIRAALAA